MKLQMLNLINFSQSEKATRAQIAILSATAQREKPFSVEDFAQRMVSFIIKRNTYANTKA